MMPNTGYYVRVLRDDEWQNLDITELTPDEIDRLAEKQPGRGWAWAKALILWMQDHLIDEV